MGWLVPRFYAVLVNGHPRNLASITLRPEIYD